MTKTPFSASSRTILNLTLAALLATSFAHRALADTVKLPVESEQGTVYVAPKVEPTEESARTHGAEVGLQGKDGGGVSGGVDTSKADPDYSVGVSTGGKVSFSASGHSDGKENTGVKAGVTIKY